MDKNLENDTVRTNRKTLDKYVIPMSIIIAGVIISISIFFTFGLTSKNINNNGIQNAQQDNRREELPNNVTIDVKNVDIKGEPYIGYEDAKLTIAYWTDFQCLFCKMFELNTLPILINKYVDTGKVRIVFKDMQFLGPDSQVAGLFAKAIWKLYPNIYMDWHTEMYKAQDKENEGFGNRSSIENLIKEKFPEMDLGAISSLIDNKKNEYQTEQDLDKEEGGKFGIDGTPGFIIGTQKISGAQPAEVFKQVIDTELNKIQ